MKKINVLVRDLTTLELVEDAKRGDIINLNELQEIDLSFINKLVNEETNKVYKERYDSQLDLAKSEFEKKLDELRSQNHLLKQQYDSDAKLVAEQNQSKMNELTAKFNDEITKLNALLSQQISNHKNEVQRLEEKAKQNEALLRQQLESSYAKQITDLNNTIENNKILYKNNLTSEIERISLTYKSQLEKLTADLTHLNENKDNIIKLSLIEQEKKYALEYDNKIKKITDDYEEQIEKLSHESETYLEEIKTLKHQKSLLNVKLIGEDLESWCNNEVISYMQSGLFNCTWEKDNETVKVDDEAKGRKADFVFKIYADDNHNKDELLASVCLDMKDEDPNSINRKKNSDYFKDLDKNRRGKDCKYAILVSTLESDKSNAVPIIKVREYEDMYIVQPAYMMTFLNILNSLSLKYKELLIQNNKEQFKLIESLKLEEEFNKLKLTYLDKPLESLQQEVIVIKKAADKIDEACDNITKKYINEITNKLERFKISRLVKKVNAIEEV